MTKNISHDLHLELNRRVDKIEDMMAGAPGPMRDILSILRLIDMRLVELERKQ